MGDGNAVAEGGRRELLAVEHFLDIASGMSMPERDPAAEQMRRTAR
jgi:hypothetical protein